MQLQRILKPSFLSRRNSLPTHEEVLLPSDRTKKMDKTQLMDYIHHPAATDQRTSDVDLDSATDEQVFHILADVLSDVVIAARG